MEEVKVAVTLLELLSKIGGIPLGLIVLTVILGPWVMMFFLNRAQEKRFSSVVSMYENNVVLVETNQSLAKDLKDLIIMNTEAMTHLNDAVHQNMFCPAIRVDKRTEQHGRKADE